MAFWATSVDRGMTRRHINVLLLVLLLGIAARLAYVGRPVAALLAATTVIGLLGIGAFKAYRRETIVEQRELTRLATPERAGFRRINQCGAHPDWSVWDLRPPSR